VEEEPIPTAVDQEVDLTEEEINLQSHETALQASLGDNRNPSPTSPSPPPNRDPFPEHVSEDNTPTITRRNTMSGVAGSSGATNPTMVSLTEAQFQALLTNTRPPPAEERTTRLKPEKPPTFNGDRTKLRSFLVLCRVYYEANRVTEDRTKITFTETLLRDAAAPWLTPYAEGKKDKTWDTYQALEEVLRIQFGDPDAEGTARNKIERLKQGNDTVTEFWNTFRL